MNPPTTVPAPALPEAVLEKLREALGPEGVSTSPVDRASLARDLWPRQLLLSRQGGPVCWPDAVLWPEDDDQVAAVYRLAQEHRFPVVPVGSSSGVCGGAVPTSGGVVLDLKRMTAIEELDPLSLLVRAQAGLNGERLERRLQARGFTLGHFPSSIYCSTVGGWVAASSAGQLSTRYGKIEDMVQGLRGVLPDGTRYDTLPAPRSAFGPDLARMIVGSEGVLGSLTAATLRIRPLPASRRFRAFLAPHVQAGTEAIRRTLQRGALPAAVRLYDELDTMIIGSRGSRRQADSPLKRMAGRLKERMPGLVRALEAAVLARPRVVRAVEKRLQGCLLLMTFEGDPELTRVEETIFASEAEQLGLDDLGPEPAEAWWGHRYSVSFKLSPLISDGFFVDTFEVATPWADLLPLYHGVRAGLGGEVATMAHFSHAYPEGCSIYFSLAGKASNEAATLALYDRTWRRALEIARRHGSTQSHHHGVGVLKQEGMDLEHGHLLRGLRAFKREVDPAWIANPGKLAMGSRPPGEGGVTP